LWTLLQRLRVVWHYERHLPAPVRIVDRIRMLRRGFLSQAAYMYDFKSHDPALFVPQIANIVYGIQADRLARPILGNKLAFHMIMARWPGSAPTLFGVIRDGAFDPDAEMCGGCADKALADLCAVQSRLFLKPFRGAGGKRAYRLEAGPQGLILNGQPCAPGDLARVIGALDSYLVLECVRPAAYAAGIYPGALNTMRIVTMRDVDTGAFFIAGAIHRFGTAKSGHVDNWSSCGLNAALDYETGLLGRVATSPDCGSIRWLERHPDTGAPITGVQVPSWQAVKDRVLEWSRGVAYGQFVGWDVALDDRGAVRAIEANCPPATSLFQVHGPIITDPRIRRFFQHYGVIA
jgi:hypothetical protein